MKRKSKTELYASLAFILLSAIWLIESMQISGDVASVFLSPRFFPRLLSVLVILLCTWSIVDWFRGPKEDVAKSEMEAVIYDEMDGQEEELPRDRRSLIRVAILIVICILYVLLYQTLGYLICTFLMVGAALITFGLRSPLKIIATAAITSAMLYLLFVYALHVNLP